MSFGPLSPIKIRHCPALGGKLRIAGVLAAVLLVAGCATTATRGAQSAAQSATTSLPPVIEESLKNIGIASPRTLLEAEAALGESTSGYSNYGLELSYVVYKMIQILYPLYLRPEYVIFPPTASIFPDLFRQVESGAFASVSQNDVSFLTLIIPPMAVLYTDNRDVIESSLEALDHAETLNPSSVLPPYLKGVIARKRGNDAVALAQFEQALNVDSSCYPAAIGAARILISQKRYAEADGMLVNLISSLPPDGELYRLDAEVQYRLGFYAQAEQEVARAQELDPKSPAAFMLSAEIFEAQKKYVQALDELSKLEKLSKPTVETYLMRARIENEAGNMAASIEALAAGVKAFPGSGELSNAYGKALIAAGQTTAGTKYLPESLAHSPNAANSLELLVSDAIASKNWKIGAAYLPRLLELRSDEHTLSQAYEIYNALGDRAKTVEYARKLHETAPSDGRYLVDYVAALIAAGDTARARSLIAQGISTGGSPAALSSLYYLRSRIQSDPGAELQDLRSALLENLENEQALIATARYYLRRGDLRSARRYAVEAEAFLPNGEKLPKDLAQLIAPGG